MQRATMLLYLLPMSALSALALSAQESRPSLTANLSWPFAYVLPQIPAATGVPVTAEYAIQLKQPLLTGRTETLVSESKIARYSDGRTWQEQRGYVPASQAEWPPLLCIVLTNPQDGSRQILDPAGRVDFKEKLPARVSVRSSQLGVERTEDLGVRTIHGLAVNGLRRTWSRPSPASGEPGRTVDESWYSKALELTVLDQRTDPSGRVVTITLSNFALREPRASLFKTPHRYRVITHASAATALWAIPPPEFGMGDPYVSGSSYFPAPVLP